MVRRLEGTYGFSRRPVQLSGPRTVIAAALEGETEQGYLTGAQQKHRFWVTLRPKVYQGHHGVGLIDNAISHARKQATQFSGASVIPVAVYDIESADGASLVAATTAIEYGRAQGVRVFINAPTIERWFLLHHQPISMFAPSAEVLEKLHRAQSSANMPVYEKPGSQGFFNEMAELQEAAEANCASHGHISHQEVSIPCMCQLFDFLRSFKREDGQV